MFRQLSYTLILFLFITSFHAAAVDLWLWETESGKMPFVLPVEDGQIPDAAAKQYVKAMRANEDLKELLKPVLPGFLKGKAIRKLNAQEEWGLALANVPDDYIANGKLKRISKLKAAAAYKNLQYYLFPVAGLLHLSPKAQAETLERFAFEPIIDTSLGGPDVAADFYEDKNYYCENCNVTRDAEEFRVIKAIAEAKYVTIFNMCRGYQAFAIYAGHKMIQDIGIEVPTTTIDHKNEWHDIKLLNTPYAYLKRAFPNQEILNVNSIHHQAILPITKPIAGRPQTFIAARADDGVIEAIEFEQGLAVQFHPELEEKLWPIVWTMIDVARERRQRLLKERSMQNSNPPLNHCERELLTI